jgi:hypothetical protein
MKFLSGYIPGVYVLNGTFPPNSTYQSESFSLSAEVCFVGTTLTQVWNPYGCIDLLGLLKNTKYPARTDRSGSAQTNTITTILIVDGGSNFMDGDILVAGDNQSGFFATFTTDPKSGTLR